jgi:hypothetical protein
MRAHVRACARGAAACGVRAHRRRAPGRASERENQSEAKVTRSVTRRASERENQSEAKVTRSVTRRLGERVSNTRSPALSRDASVASESSVHRDRRPENPGPSRSPASGSLAAGTEPRAAAGLGRDLDRDGPGPGMPVRRRGAVGRTLRRCRGRRRCCGRWRRGRGTRTRTRPWRGRCWRSTRDRGLRPGPPAITRISESEDSDNYPSH